VIVEAKDEEMNKKEIKKVNISLIKSLFSAKKPPQFCGNSEFFDGFLFLNLMVFLR